MKTGRRVWKTKSPYTPDFLTGKQIRNQGDLDMYFIEAAHEAILNSMVCAETTRGIGGEMYYSLAEFLAKIG